MEAATLKAYLIVACEAGGDADAGEQGLEVVEPDVRPRRRAVLPVPAPAWHTQPCFVNVCDKIGGGDCLVKTQDAANLYNDV